MTNKKLPDFYKIAPAEIRSLAGPVAAELDGQSTKDSNILLLRIRDSGRLLENINNLRLGC